MRVEARKGEWEGRKNEVNTTITTHPWGEEGREGLKEGEERVDVMKKGEGRDGGME